MLLYRINVEEEEVTGTDLPDYDDCWECLYFNLCHEFDSIAYGADSSYPPS